MNSLLRIGLRAAAVGLYAGLGYLVVNQPIGWDDALNSAYIGYGGFLTYVGLGTFTDLEPTLGITKGK